MPELIDVLFDDLRSSKKNMNRLLGVGLLFTLIAHFYVVEPYFEYKEQEPRLKKSLDEKKKQFDQLSDQSERITNLSQNIKTNQTNIENKIKDFPQHLRGILSDIWKIFLSESSSNAQRSGPAQQSINTQKPANEIKKLEDNSNMPFPVQQSLQTQQSRFRKIGDFFLPSEIATFNDGVHWYIETWFNNLLNDIREQIEKPIKQAKITSDMAEGIDLENVTKQGIKDIQKYIDKVEKENPNFWRNYSGPRSKLDVAQELQNEVKKSFGLLEDKINMLVERLKEAVIVQKGELDKMNNDMKKLQDSKEELDTRLSTLESPLGRIPADLPDLIKLFPIILAGLMVIVTATLQKGNSLYIALWGEFKKGNNESDYRVFRQHADCWYLPPYSSIFQPLVLGVCMTIIIGVFVRSFLLVIAEPGLFTSFTGEFESFKRNLF